MFNDLINKIETVLGQEDTYTVRRALKRALVALRTVRDHACPSCRAGETNETLLPICAEEDMMEQLEQEEEA